MLQIVNNFINIYQNISSNLNNSTNDKTLNYRSYLNLDYEKDLKLLKKEIVGTACIVYDENYNLNPTACKSWYDTTSRLVLCECSVPGLIVNLFNLTLSEINRNSQFKRPSFSYRKIIPI